MRARRRGRARSWSKGVEVAAIGRAGQVIDPVPRDAGVDGSQQVALESIAGSRETFGLDGLPQGAGDVDRIAIAGERPEIVPVEYAGLSE
jgi:hypothetical protein